MEFAARFKDLRASSLYTPKVQAYLRREWLQPDTINMWAWYARQAFHGGINTNNYQEAMNRKLKRQWLNDRHDHRLQRPRCAGLL